jgi:hypothetical protein
MLTENHSWERFTYNSVTMFRADLPIYKYQVEKECRFVCVETEVISCRRFNERLRYNILHNYNSEYKNPLCFRIISNNNIFLPFIQFCALHDKNSIKSDLVCVEDTIRLCLSNKISFPEDKWRFRTQHLGLFF